MKIIDAFKKQIGGDFGPLSNVWKMSEALIFAEIKENNKANDTLSKMIDENRCFKMERFGDWDHCHDCFGHIDVPLKWALNKEFFDTVYIADYRVEPEFNDYGDARLCVFEEFEEFHDTPRCNKCYERFKKKTIEQIHKQVVRWRLAELQDELDEPLKNEKDEDEMPSLSAQELRKKIHLRTLEWHRERGTLHLLIVLNEDLE